jgi:hypothetical protein
MSQRALLNKYITTCFGLNPSHHRCYRTQNTKCKLSLRILTDLLNLCQNFLAITKIDGVKAYIYVYIYIYIYIQWQLREPT